MPMSFLRRATLVAAALGALPALAAAQQITVSAAVSLTDAFKEIGPKFQATKPGSSVRFNFAASGVLLQQISQDAPVDVFASADQETMNRAADQKLIDPATRRDFAANSVVLVTPAANAVPIRQLADLGKPEVKRIAIGKTETVPVGRYTKQSLDAANLWSTLEPKFVQADSVRQVLDYVARGEAEAGFVYRTDAAIMADKVAVALTATGHTPVRYPLAVVAESKQQALAKDFADYLLSPAGQEVLARYGFGKP